MDGLLGGFVHHQLDALQAEYVGNLMRIDEHARGAAHRRRPHELGDSEHARLDVHVTIQQSRYEVASLRLDDLCLLPNRMAGIRSHIGNVPIHNGNIGMRDKLAGLNADPSSITDHKVGRGASHGNINERTGKFCRGCHPISSVFGI